jgi:RNA polymerase sigma-70 factor (ECF subfamily)
MSDNARGGSPPDASRPRPAGELDRLTAMEYETLRELAHRLKRRGLAGPADPGTDSLVHESYLRLRSGGNKSWHDRTHFLAVVVLQLRHILVDHARGTRAQKRGRDHVRVSLDTDSLPTKEPAMDVLVLDEALNRLARQDARQHRVAELRLFGALTVEEIATFLEVSERTVKEDWRLARVWLARELWSDRAAPRKAGGPESLERGRSHPPPSGDTDAGGGT